MTDPVQLKYTTKDGAERIVILPTIDIDAPDMVTFLAGIIIHQHDQLVKMNRRIESLGVHTFGANEVVSAAQEGVGEIPHDMYLPADEGEPPAENAADRPESEYRKKN